MPRDSYFIEISGDPDHDVATDVCDVVMGHYNVEATVLAAVPVEGVWLRSIGDELQVLVECNGAWRNVITEARDGNISHIVEEAGIRSGEVE